MPKDFIIFFEGKEGTSPLVRFLNNFDQVSVVHQEQGTWEPFDRHACGSISIQRLGQLLDLIYSREALDMTTLNDLYTLTAKKKIAPFQGDGVVGLKMRFRPKEDLPRLMRYTPLGQKRIKDKYRSYQRYQFKQLMIDTLKKHKIVVFMALRQDTFRWALSRYHGDGTGKQGHLQFKLAQGLLKKEDIPKLYVDCDRLEKEISRCKVLVQQKRDLMVEFNQLGVESYPLIYEEFCDDKNRYFERLFQRLEFSVSSEEIESRLAQGSKYRKVHSKNISEFVENHEEVLERFGNLQEASLASY